MALWGSIQAMKQSYEQNRALLKSRKSRKKQLNVKGISAAKKKILEFKKVSEEELKKIKAKINKKKNDNCNYNNFNYRNNSLFNSL